MNKKFILCLSLFLLIVLLGCEKKELGNNPVGEAIAQDTIIIEEEYKPILFKFPKETAESKKVQELTKKSADLNNKAKTQTGAVKKSTLNELKTALQDRKKSLEVLIEKNPTLAYVSLMPKSISSQYPAEMQQYIEQPVSMTSQIEYIHKDDFKNKRTEDKFYLKKGKDRLSFYPVGSFGLISGSTISLKGYQLSNKVIAPTSKEYMQVLSAETPDSIGPQKTLFILLKFLDSPPEPVTREQAYDIIFNGQMQKFYNEASYGKVSWTGDVIGWYTVPRNRIANGVCNDPGFSGDWAGDEIYKLIKRDINITGYDRVVMIPFPSCNGGWGSVGKDNYPFDGKFHNISIASIGVIDTYNTPSYFPQFLWNRFYDVLSHELGHNLGVVHANAWVCLDGNILYGDCNHAEYGNSFDVMGVGQFSEHFNAYFKDVFRWVDDSSLTIQQSGTYTINPLESKSGTHIAKIQVPLLNFSPYYIEYRRGIGFDAHLNDPLLDLNQEGLMINWKPDPNAPMSRILDMSKGDEKNNWFNVSLLKSSRGKKLVFSDKGRGVIIGPIISNNASSITFDVKIVKPTCISSYPSVELSDYAVRTISGNSNIISYAIQNINSPTCKPARFLVEVSVPVGWAFRLNEDYPLPNPITLESESQPSIGNLRIDIPLNTINGIYNVTLKVTNLDSPGKLKTEKKLQYHIGDIKT